MKTKFITPLLLCITMNVFSQTVDLHKREIIFGNGGGIVGAMNEYRLSEKGEITFKSKLEKEPKIIKALPQDSTDSFFVEAEKVFAKTTIYRHPGNMYNFVKLKKGLKMCEITWGEAKLKSPPSAKKLHDKLMKVCANTKK